jgi:hypothetical protein
MHKRYEAYCLPARRFNATSSPLAIRNLQELASPHTFQLQGGAPQVCRHRLSVELRQRPGLRATVRPWRYPRVR